MGSGADTVYEDEQDDVNHPSHYTSKKWEVIDVLEEFFPEDPLLFNVGKYLMRHELKENPLKDLKKAAWYLQRKINKLEAKDANKQKTQGHSS